MFLRLFKSGQPALLFFIPIFAGLLWLKYFIIPQPVEMVFEPNPMPFYAWISKLLANSTNLAKIISLSLLTFTGLWLARLNTKFIILQKRTYLPAVLYIMLVSSYQPLQTLNPAVFAAVFLVLGIEIMFDAYRKEGLALEFFMASFLISTACMFYARSAWLMLIVWTGLALFRTVYWREWVLTFFGFATPVIFLFAWYYLSGQDIASNWEAIRYNFVHVRTTELPGLSYLIFYGYLVLIILLASQKMLSNFQQLKIYIRKFFRLNFWIFAFVLAPFIFIYNAAFEMIYFLAVPVSYILSYYFFNTRSNLSREIIFTLLLAGYGAILVFN